MITAERFQEVDGALPAMAEAATRGGSARGLIAVYSSLGFCKLRLGALPEADGAARVALRILQEGDFTPGLGVAAIAAEVAIEAGELDEAQALLELIPPGPAGVLSVLAPAAWQARPGPRRRPARADLLPGVPGHVRCRRVGHRDP